MKHVLFVNSNYNDILPLIPFIEYNGANVSTAGTLNEALSIIHNNHDIDVVIADSTLPDGHGVELLTDNHNALSRPAMKLFLAHDKKDAKTLSYARSRGANYFLEKPVTIDHLERIFSDIDPVKLSKKTKGGDSMEDEPHYDFGHLVGRSSVMKDLYHTIECVAPTSASVFVIGESGTGKELIAQSIHQYSLRASKPFIAINCGALSPELISSALFGHEKGSFTGASQSHKGYFEQASGGTLFLDEITETSQTCQVNLLRVLETGTILPVGGKRQIEVDVRIIASTNRNPEEAVKQGILRKDLYHRLNVFPIVTAPLNHRQDDIILLAQHFLKLHNRHDGKAVKFTPEALKALCSTHFSGNVRQLKNVIHRAYILSEGGKIDIAHLKPANLRMTELQDSISFSIKTPLKAAQQQLAQFTLDYFGGDKKLAAQSLDITEKELSKLLGK